MATKYFKLGTDYPYEGFVQSSIEAYFVNRGFELDQATHADLSCAHPETGERWLVEAKGVTTEIGSDFRTGLGQLVQRMSDASVKYGVAFPEVEQFLSQCRLVSVSTRSRLALHWLVVNHDGAVRIVGPEENL